jgi:hypothetical protein
MAIVSTVPILKPLRQEGSTFYTFSGAVNDSILLFSNSNVRFNFSKFVCIKLPNWENVAKQRLYRNPVDLESINDSSAGDDPNTFFTKAYLQNYIENFSNIMDAYRLDNTYANFTEAAFWKSLQNVSNVDNAVDDSYKTIQLISAATYQDSNLVTREKFKERADVDNEYESIIKFVGDINMLNHVKKNGKEYLEVYAHVPTGAGKITDVLLKYNDALKPTLGQVPETSGPEYIQGQEDSYNNADASEKTYTKAIYDTNDRKYNANTDKDFLQLDWDDIESNEAKETKHNNGSFDFNAVLVYYDVWDKTNPATKKRNLYGILVLDKMEQVAPTIHRIAPFKKYQPNENQAGNSFGFRFNLMFSNNTNQLTSEISINDYSTVSMELYMSALQRLQTISGEYDRLSDIIHLQSKKLLEMEQNLLSFQTNLTNNFVDEAPNDNNSYARRNKTWQKIED